MTPAQVEEAARNRYNAVTSSFYSQDEVFKIIYEAEQELATELLVIQDLDTSTSTAIGTRSYAFPSLTIAIKRIEYDGRKLTKTDFRQDDDITLYNANSTNQGTPQYYSIWNDTIYLRAIPDAVKTLKIYRYKQATLLTTASSSLSVPVFCHSALIDYTASLIASKDGNFRMADRFMNRWNNEHKPRIKAFVKKRERQDSFASVKDEESQISTFLGAV